MRPRIAKNPAFMTITSHVGHENTPAETYLDPWGFIHEPAAPVPLSTYTVCLSPLWDKHHIDSHFLYLHCSWLSWVWCNEQLEIQNCVDVDETCHRCEFLSFTNSNWHDDRKMTVSQSSTDTPLLVIWYHSGWYFSKSYTSWIKSSWLITTNWDGHRLTSSPESAC